MLSSIGAACSLERSDGSNPRRFRGAYGRACNWEEAECSGNYCLHLLKKLPVTFVSTSLHN